MNAILNARDICKRYRRNLVLNHLNLEVPEGSIYGLIGSNGAGKTTAIKVLMNIIRPSSGLSAILGVDSQRLQPKDMQRIGYVSENQELPEWMTVEYLLSYLKPFYPTWDDSRSTELVKQFNLPRDRQLRHLSRGMRMKTMLAAALAYRPRVLVMDEPFSGVDAVVREDLTDSLLESADETTIFISSHDLADIESFASHIGYLEDGHLQFSEEMGALTSRFREIEVLLEAPVAVPSSSGWPAHWLRPETTPAFVRFVETRFEPEQTGSEIRRQFGERVRVSVNPMPLKAIFVTLARSAAKTA